MYAYSRDLEEGPCTEAPREENMAHAGLMKGDLHWLQSQKVDEDLLFRYTRSDTLAGILESWTLWLGRTRRRTTHASRRSGRPGSSCPRRADLGRKIGS